MGRESQRGVGREASGPHGYTVKLEAYLRGKGEEGATLDELTEVAVREAWISRGFAHRMYANRLNAQRKIDKRLIQETDSLDQTRAEPSMTPELVAMQGLYPQAVRYLLAKGLNGGRASGRYRKVGTGRHAVHVSTGKGLVQKPQGGWTEEELTRTPAEIGADVAMREVIRMLKPYKDQKTHKVTQAEWNAIRHWLNLVAITWDQQ